jgi:hypothetical protein
MPLFFDSTASVVGRYRKMAWKLSAFAAGGTLL